MTPGTEVTWLDAHADASQMRAAVMAGAHSRYPVCRSRLDDVVGVVQVRQLAERQLAGHPLDLLALAEVVAMIPDGTSVVRLFEMFRQGVSPLIVVLDEYGAVEGIVTPADVLGAIAGELTANEREERPDAVQRADGSWLVDGRIEIHRLERLLDRRDLAHPGRYQTLAGLVLWELGTCPESATPSFAAVSASRWSISTGAGSIACSSRQQWTLPTHSRRSRIDRTHRPVRLAGLGSVETASMSFEVPQRNQALVIRRARPGDAGAIAQVHVQSWRESYRGIVPDGYLAQMSVAGHERQWRQNLAAGGWAFVAEWEQRLVGFASGGLSRGRRDISGELYLLYVLRANQGRGIGRALFDACHYELARCGHRGLLVWVLADNSARRFYERLGGERSGESAVTIAGARLRELAYAWRD